MHSPARESWGSWDPHARPVHWHMGGVISRSNNARQHPMYTLCALSISLWSPLHMISCDRPAFRFLELLPVYTGILNQCPEHNSGGQPSAAAAIADVVGNKSAVVDASLS